MSVSESLVERAKALVSSGWSRMFGKPSARPVIDPEQVRGEVDRSGKNLRDLMADRKAIQDGRVSPTEAADVSASEAGARYVGTEQVHMMYQFSRAAKIRAAANASSAIICRGGKLDNVTGNRRYG